MYQGICFLIIQLFNNKSFFADDEKFGIKYLLVLLLGMGSAKSNRIVFQIVKRGPDPQEGLRGAAKRCWSRAGG